ERVAVSNILTVGKLVPAGGGSGGGDDGVAWGIGDSNSFYNSGNCVAPPSPQGLLGLNAQTVFGVNHQTAVGVNSAHCVGSNVQIVLNPVGLLSLKEKPTPILDALLGAGLGGNTQFTLGLNSQFTLGRQHDVSIGPMKIERTADHKERMLIHVLG